MTNEAKLRDYLKRATTDLRKTRRRLDELEAGLDEPIAILGMACRYSGGVGSPEELWQLVAEGKDAISEFPSDRGWDLERLYDPDPDHPGTSYTREGGFLEQPGHFDPEFFGISPREALAMDPQQRLLLEASWEALEDAGLDLAGLRGTPAGVFAGLGAQSLMASSQEVERELEGYRLTGAVGSVASGRIAYTLGLQGPAMTIDTACSSSLVAMHLAAQALRGGECSLALAGGATVLTTPGLFTEFSRQRGLAPDGRCKPFAEAADGTGWGEGVGMLVLERLSDAQRNGHPILAVIRGSAVNQDGASNGLTAPNGPSQERVIRQALANARLEPKDVDVVEAHGTGTTLGDPIEAGALLATYGQDREEPLRLGSVKSNIGHTAAAAGVAGVIKTVMAMREGVLPKTLHLDAPSSKVDWEAGEIELLAEAEPWQPNGKPRRAGVSSFGISGTNAHVILEQAPEPTPVGAGAGLDPDAASGACSEITPLPTIPLVLSAKSKHALSAQAERLVSHLKDNPQQDLTDTAYSLATTRTSFEHRAVALGSDRKEIQGALSALAAGADHPALIQATAQSQRPIFLFGGQGSQWQGMAVELLDSSPTFATHIQACEEALAPYVDWSLTETLHEDSAEWMDRLDIVQPALFAVMVSLARLWEEHGVKPAAVIGHSQGEIAAAHIAGGLSLDDAARVIALRAKAMTKIAGEGGMLSVSLTPKELEPRLEPLAKRISLAAINGPRLLVLSGDPDALEEFEAQCDKDGIRAQIIAVDYAAHSVQIEALKDELLESFAAISPTTGEIPFHSTVTGEVLDTKELDAEYWYRNLRETVLLEPVLTSALKQGQRSFIELSPHPVLGFGLQEAIDAQDTSATVISTLRRDEGGPERFTRSLAEAHANGIAIDWGAFFEYTGAKAVSLPTYAFQRKRYWLNASAGSASASSIGQSDAEHPLLSAIVEDPQGEGLTLTGRISLDSHPWLKDHAVAGNVLLPGTAFLELALRAGEQAGAETVEELTLQAPLVIPEQGAIQLQVSVAGSDEQGNREISIHSRPESTGEDELSGPSEWTLNATGLLSDAQPDPQEPLSPWPPEAAEPIDVTDLYGLFVDMGLEYGEAFQGLSAAWRDGEEIYAEVALPEEQAERAQRFAIHPALLDAALHSIALKSAGSEGGAKLPFAWSGVSLNAQGAAQLRVKLSATAEGRAALSLTDQDGVPVAQVASLALRDFDPAQLQGQGQSSQPLYGIEWSEVELGEEVDAPFVLEGNDLTSLQEALADEDAELPETLLWRFAPQGGDDPAKAARSASETALALIQQFLAEERLASTRLAILTEGAVAASEEESPELAAASLWGLVRSAQSEHPERFVLIDSDGSDASEASIAKALGTDEAQLALREGVALAPRASRELGSSLLPPLGPWRLDAPKRGSLEALSLIANPEAQRPLGPSEVRVEVRAAGLNFRDVLIALGHYPGAAEIGSEAAGVVVEVGSEVDDLSPGDRVMGTIAGAFAPLAVGERAMLAKVPESWSFEQAAALPTVFLTARYGLLDLAGLKKNEKVLIHAGAGGVGMAAIGLAQSLGAEVFATASEAKWDVLRKVGLDDDHIASSRDTDFKEKFLSQTDGEGVDVVLNALAGEFVDASLDLLPNGGRFLEMGKTDIRDPEQLTKSHPAVTYRAFDLIEAGPQRMGEMLTETIELFEAGKLNHSPITTWDIRKAPEAFRHLREGQNVGKVVLELPQAIDPDKTILITGATGGLGSLVARHLAEHHGARHLLLASRSGAKADGAKEFKAELEELGAKATIAACDVSDPTQLKDLLASIPKAHPLGAVIHAAGVLDDATIDSLSPEHFQRVFAPKADAAWNLHELTKDQGLSAFVLFSSAAATLGGPGQGNYAAANSFLDALAQQRASEDLPASSIAWGLWQREGAMTSHLGEADLARMARAGVGVLSDEQGLELFDRALGAQAPNVLALELVPAGLRAQAQAGVLPAILSGLVGASTRRSAASGVLAAKLATLPEAERERYVLEMVRAEVATVLGHDSAEAIEPDKAFKEMGFDSLAAVEMRNRLNTATGLRLAPTTAFDYPNPAVLARYLLAKSTAGDSAKQVAVRAQATDEPIAILGMACRYPGGVSSPEELWQLVAEGRDGISEFPNDRGWDLERLYDPDPDAPHTSYAREGGFLADAGHFDPEFFGIAPREALAMDPQQRLLLEASWEALEDAGIDPSSLRGQAAGVFAGLSAQSLMASSQEVERELEGYRMTGAIGSVASGRIAYTLGLEGPAMTIDTACSSSLVAMHLAAQALRQGECSLALAGGATVLTTPGLFTEFSRQRGLAPDGRSKPFAEAADGAGFSDGAGMLVLQRLSDAQREGHPILATIRGSAVNQDGASNGLTAPNGPSQERVIRQALANARLESKDIDAVEAHGTGTILGDPIEAGALIATYGQDREEPLRVGSIKSNIGHSAAAAGVAGVIKTVMAMREGVLPKTLHLDQPSSKVDWEAGEIELLAEPIEWQTNGRPRRAGVSSFGISGTNAHVILEQAPDPAEVEQSPEGGEATPLPITPLVLSAKSKDALSAQAERLAFHLSQNLELDTTDVAYSLATRRSAFEQRAVVLGSDRDQLLGALSALAAGTDAPGLVRGSARFTERPIFLFGGQGSQWQGMAQELLDSSPTFATHIQACEEALAPYVDWSLQETLREDSAEWMDRLDVVQPALFAVMVSLARLWEELGVKPAAVIGHSQGEIAAAHIAGGLSLDDAARTIALRAKAMTKIAGKGAMLSVSLTAKELEPRLEPFAKRISLAAINGPASLVCSGDPDALEEFEAQCDKDGIRAQLIAVDYAAHSAQIEALKDELLDAFAPTSPTTGEIPFHSTVTGELLDTKELDAEYWYRNLRETVLLEPVLSSLLEQGQRSFIELSPHPVLGFGLQEAIDAQNTSATVISTLRRDEGGLERFTRSLAEAHAAGIQLDWHVFFKPTGAKAVSLPTYAFQRKRYWLNASGGSSDPTAIGQSDAEHPLLGASVQVAGGEQLLLTGRLSLDSHPWLKDHAVAGNVLLPGTAFLELALRAGEQAGTETVEELTLQAPLILPEQGAIQLQVSVAGPDEQGNREISIHSRSESTGEEELSGPIEWTLNATGLLSEAQPEPQEPLGPWPPEGAEPIDVEDLYGLFGDFGLEYGEAFQGLTAAWRAGEEIYAEVALPQEQAEAAQRFAIHPALLDAALHAIALKSAGSGAGVKLPFAWSGVSLQGQGASQLRVKVSATAEGQAALSLSDQDGAPIAQVASLALRDFDPAQLQGQGQSSQPLFGIECSEVELGEEVDAPFALEGNDLSSLQEALADQDAEPPEALLWRFAPEGGEDPAKAARHASETALALIQTFLATERLASTRLAILTEGAVAAKESESPELDAASLWGLLRSAQSEHPERFVLIDSDGSEASEAAIAKALGTEEPQLALREGVALAPRAIRIATPDSSEEQAPAFDPDMTILITGATGGLGSLVACHLAEQHGARHLLLASRSGAKAQGAMELKAELEELGAKATIEACDISDPTQLKELLASIPKAHPLGAVVHAAGALDDATIDSLSPAHFERVFAPKADAAWTLHELTKEQGLSAFVLFSSAAASLGAPGQGNYAAANSFLDALAKQRASEGLPATSIAWGLWQRESAMTSELSEADLARMARAGVGALSDRQGLELFDRALGTEMANNLALQLQPAGLRAQAKAGVLPAILSGLVRVPSRRSAASGALAAKLATLPQQERESYLLDLVRGEVATVLGHGSPDAVEPRKAFQEMGFDSLAAIEMRNRLNTATGLRLAPTTVFDYPNPAALAGYLLAEVVPLGGERSEEADFRDALSRIPLSRFRDAGLVETLIELAKPDGESPRGTDGSAIDEIDEMDIDELVQRTLESQSTDLEEAGEG